MRNRHCPDPTSSRLPHGPMRSRVTAVGASMSTSTSYRDGTLSMADRTKAAASSAGGRRGMAWAPVIFGSASRSSRNVRQSNRVRSHATRYQRLPSRTSRCGSTSRALCLAAPVGIRELQALAVAAGLGDRHEDVGLDARRRLLPGRRDGHRSQGVDAAAERGRHDLDHFAQGPHVRTLRCPMTVPAWMAECSPTPMATASSSSSRSGGSTAPAANW